MKKFLSILLTICAAIAFMGAAKYNAPVLPSKNFYINDYAGLIGDEQRNIMLKAARGLNEETGAKVVVLTVESFSGIEAKDYAKRIFDGWEIGGEGILILFSLSDGELWLKVGSGLAAVFDNDRITHIKDNVIIPFFVKGDYAGGIYEGFSAVTNDIYENYGLEQSGVPEGNKNESGMNAGVAAIFLAVLLFIVLRLWRVSARYRKKYAKGYVYKPRTFERIDRDRDDYDIPSGFGGLGSFSGLVDLTTPADDEEENEGEDTEESD